MSKNKFRARRISAIFAIFFAIFGGILFANFPEISKNFSDENTKNSEISDENISRTGDNSGEPLAAEILAKLPVKGRAPKTGYSREKFGGEWKNYGGKCDERQKILDRDLTEKTYLSGEKIANCVVATGVFDDPYTGKTINFSRDDASAVQIDHAVAISDAWQTGAQNLTQEIREEMYNDPLELLASDGPANSQKSDGDAATWLPPNKNFRCQYVARQIAVKRKYSLWVKPAEKTAMENVLKNCPEERLPAP